jgi:hypothetical protein
LLVPVLCSIIAVASFGFELQTGASPEVHRSSQTRQPTPLADRMSDPDAAYTARSAQTW